MGAMHTWVARVWPNLLSVALASVLSFLAGSATGSVSAYVGVRSDVATLGARVTVDDERIAGIETSIVQWRAEDEANAQNIQNQIKDAVALLTDLRIRMGEPKR